MERDCEYVMCDGHDCPNSATRRVGRAWYCEDHAEAMETGIDPMFEDSIDYEELLQRA
jgi:hypothetical protein